MSLSSHGRRNQVASSWTWGWLCCLLVASTVVLYVAKTREYQHGIEVERSQLQSQAGMMEAALSRHLYATNLALVSVTDALQPVQKEVSGELDLSARLSALSDAAPGVSNILILNTMGRVVSASDLKFMSLDFSQAAFFRSAMRAASPNRLYVGPPIASAEGSVAITLSRLVVDAAGKPQSLAVALLDPEQFRALAATAQFERGVVAAIVHDNGELFVSAPPVARDAADFASLLKIGMRTQATARGEHQFTHFSGSQRALLGVALRNVSMSGLNPDRTLFVLMTRPVGASMRNFWTGTYVQAALLIILAATLMVALIRQRRRQARDQQNDRDLRVAAVAFESLEGIVVTDPMGVILRVNRAFSDLTGFPSAEVVGQTSRILRSGRHDAQFYEGIWDALRTTGTWQGEIWHRRSSGEVFPDWVTITAVRDESGAVVNFVATHSDITSRKSAEDEIKNLAFYDPLTLLPNRRLLMDRLRHAMANGARSGQHGALVFIDLDDFKIINDTLGHHVGDMLLQHVAERLTRCVREQDTVARLGGDEFVVMLENISRTAEEAAEQASTTVEQIRVSLSTPYDIEAGMYRSTASIGVTLFCGHVDSVGELLKRADLAMYKAKASGRNCMCFFDPRMQTEVTTKVAMEEALRSGLLHREFVLLYQPQVDGHGKVTGVEALMRWQHPERGLVSPALFIPLAESTGLILELGTQALRAACEQIVHWQRTPSMDGLTIAVNVSAHQFRQPDFVTTVRRILAQTCADATLLKLELTESMLVEDVDDVIRKMSELREAGVEFALDDFGTGYSSLSYLQRLPLQQIKIDQSFVRHIRSDSNNTVIIKAIINLAHNLNLGVIAEGVENADQLAFLRQHHCDLYQGFLFSRALSSEQVQEWVQSRSTNALNLGVANSRAPPGTGAV